MYPGKNGSSIRWNSCLLFFHELLMILISKIAYLFTGNLLEDDKLTSFENCIMSK